MVFASQIFLFAFLPAVLVLYYATGRRGRAPVLLAASYFFYAWGAPQFVLILLAGTYFDFVIARLMVKREDPQARTALLVLSVAVNLGILGYYKYAGFFVTGFYDLLKWAELVDYRNVLQIALPIGISFFTFHKLSYIIDVYRGTVQPMQRFSLFAIYVAFFPQLVAGPIVRYNQIADQLVARSHTLDKFFDGIVRFCFGLGKKVLIANVLGRTADTMLGQPAGVLTWGGGWLAMLCYTFQIYFDFSGYSDMAVGLGRMFGFTLPENFNQPYVSRSITEFWRRWHMSLSAWFKDYLYIPLGGNRVSPGRTYLNLWIVFLLCGLWHGANWTFIAWGCYHGLWLVIERAYLLKRLERLPAVVTIPSTFIVVLLGWVLFRAPDVAHALSLLQTMFSPSAATIFARPLGDFFDTKVIVVLAAAAALSFHSAVIGALPQSIRDAAAPAGRNVWARGCAAVSLFALAWAALASGSFNPFIYYRF